ncbi:MAG: hypothetical protein ACR2O8_00425 [Rhizobiaceae bacterium]
MNSEKVEFNSHELGAGLMAWQSDKILTSHEFEAAVRQQSLLNNDVTQKLSGQQDNICTKTKITDVYVRTLMAKWKPRQWSVWMPDVCVDETEAALGSAGY